MTIANPTPHEVEALRVAEEITALGCWASASTLLARMNGLGLNDDADLRRELASVGRTEEQIGDSIRRVHQAIEAASVAQEGV